MHQTATITRRPRQAFGVMNLLAAMRQVAVNRPGSGFDGPGHVSCEERDMATQTANRRESDRVPMGVESALPWVPVPSSEQPKAKTGVLRKLVLALLVLIFLLGLWKIGKELYIQAKARPAQVIDTKR